MPGIGSVLNIAKEALMAHQQSVAVAGHNIANVDTPGYTRQVLSLTTSTPTPEGIGFFGTGVRGEEINRQYDQFMVRRLVDQNSILSDLEAQQESLRLVETSFNEAPGLAVNELMSEFWASWQTLSDYTESTPTRDATVQQAKILIDQFYNMTAEIAQSRIDMDSSLDAAVSEVNMLTQQLAELNGQISSSESELNQQNDLRDQRDNLLNDLSQYLEVNYFEISTGAYTIMMSDGHTLVENNESWEVDWVDDELQWVSRSATGDEVKVGVGDGEELGGKIGGWMEIYNELTPGHPENYLGRLDALANAMIREVNQQHVQGVGLVRFSDQLTSADPANNTALLTTTLDTLTATDTIEAGSLEINGREIGDIDGATATYGLAQSKTYNAVQAINDAITGVRAKMTTQVAGDTVTAMTVAENGSVIDFQINGVDISYTVDSVGGPPNDTDPLTLADNIVDAINVAIINFNAPPLTTGNTPPISIEAVRGDGTNGGALNSIILRNTNAGDESRIIISGAEDTAVEQKMGLIDDTYTADATHNTGQLSLFSHENDIEIDGGTDDRFLEQLGLGGGNISSTDEGGDGQLVYTASDGQVLYSLQGYAYSDELVTDGGSFKVWLYNNDDTLGLPQPVEIDLERAYDLKDVVDAINTSMIDAGAFTTDAGGNQIPWLTASIQENHLVLTPDTDHQYAFTEDTSNFLATAGLNTFFTGSSASDIGVNEVVEDNLENIAAGTVSSIGEIFRGDNSNALLITDIQRDEYIRFTGGSRDTLDAFYNTLVGDIGLKGRTVERDYEYNTLITSEFSAMRDAISGVSLDEEMADLIKYQQAYSAAAKLITSSDEMMQTLLQAV